MINDQIFILDFVFVEIAVVTPAELKIGRLGSAATVTRAQFCVPIKEWSVSFGGGAPLNFKAVLTPPCMHAYLAWPFSDNLQDNNVVVCIFLTFWKSFIDSLYQVVSFPVALKPIIDSFCSLNLFRCVHF